jgi:hypothetical protein
MELYTQISGLIKHYTTSMQFGIRYCNGRREFNHWDFSGASNLSELHWFLEKTILIRRLKNDVLQQLPKKTRQCVMVEIPAKSKKTLSDLMKNVRACDDKLDKMKHWDSGAKDKIRNDRRCFITIAVSVWLANLKIFKF